MFARLSFFYYDVKDSLWFRPALMTLGAIVLAYITLTIDHLALDGENLDTWWLFEGSATGARGVLSSIAGTMMTVVTTAFSITMVTLQLGSSQYSPRILRNFTGDRGNQLVLGVFIATFVYCLLVLRSVRSEAEEMRSFIPSLSISVAILLALVCIGSLIYFFHHASRTIQASVILNAAANDTYSVIDDHMQRVADSPMTDRIRSLQDHLAVVGRVVAAKPGYIRGIDDGRLKHLAIEHDLLLTMHPRVGDYLYTGSLLATVQRFTGRQPGEESDDEEDTEGGSLGRLEDMAEDLVGNLRDVDTGEEEESETVSDEDERIRRDVRAAYTLGLERTLNEDVLLGFQQLTDIGLRALSPGVNDPTTAMLSIDQLGEGLIRVRETDTRPRVVMDDGGTPRVIYPAMPFGLFLQMSAQHIRKYAATDPLVSAHLIKMLKMVWSVAGDSPAGHELREEARRVVEAVRAHEPLPSDLAMVREAAAWAFIPADALAVKESGSVVFPE